MELVKRIFSPLGLAEFYAALGDLFRESLGQSEFSLVLVDRDSGRLAVQHSRAGLSLDGKTIDDWKKTPLALANSGKSWFATEGRAWQMTGASGTVPVHALLPLAFKDEVYGFLLGHAPLPPEVGHKPTATWLRTVALFAGIALVRLQLYDEARDENRALHDQLAAMREAGSLLGNLDLALLLPALLELGLATTKSQLGAIVLWEDAAWKPAAELGFSGEILQEIRLTDGDRLVDLVHATGQSMLFTDFSRDPRIAHSARGSERGAEPPRSSEHGVEIGSLIVVPLSSRRRKIGVIGFVKSEGAPFSRREIELAQMIAAIGGTAVENVFLHQEGLEKERWRQEVLLAGEIQRRLISRALPSLPGWEVASHWAPCEHAAGDYYDILALGDSKIGLVMGDVTGHGIAPGMVMAGVAAYLRAFSRFLTEPGEILRELQRELANQLLPGTFMTLFFARIDLVTGEVDYANAAHEGAYRIASAQAWFPLSSTGGAIGIGQNSPATLRTILAPGEAILLVTDGVFEQHDARGEAFGRERLVRNCDRMTAGPLGDWVLSLASAVGDFRGDQAQEDDLSLLVVRRSPA